MSMAARRAEASWRIGNPEFALLAGAGTALLFALHGEVWLDDLNRMVRSAVLFVWLFGVIMWCAFAVVRHANGLAALLGEPYGTLILTMSVIVIEVSLISGIMLSGESNPTLARDAMFAVLMLVMNGLVGLVLLLGALRYRQQDYNLEGARAFLVVIVPLSVLALMLPNYTHTPLAAFTHDQALLFALLTTALYAVFLAVQTVRHSAFFLEPTARRRGRKAAPAAPARHGPPPRSLAYHGVMLVLTLLCVVAMSESLAALVDHGIEELGAPHELGGVAIALLVLSPEGLTAISAAMGNQLQRAVNVCLGSDLSTIGLTIPAVLLISYATGHPIVLGLTDPEMLLLVLTLFVSALTFGGVRTSVLQGTVHLVLFAVYLALIVMP
jgi:Ca2+:H+ antiporter